MIKCDYQSDVYVTMRYGSERVVLYNLYTNDNECNVQMVRLMREGQHAF